MIRLYTLSDLNQVLTSLRDNNLTLGFVPTMGALHPGHGSLVARAVAENDHVLASIFVNPAQFNDSKDFEKYPRTPDNDAALLEPTGCHYLFMPSPEEMIPEDLQVPDFDFKQLETTMEGAFRPGHFKGMALIVYRFFNLIKPDKAYFGEKDFQQLAIVKEMNREYNLGIEVIGCPTIREQDGLALSSRNIHLTPEERKAAPVIYASLLAAAEMVRVTLPGKATEMIRQQIERYPFFKVQYIAFVDSDSLQPIEEYDPYRNQRACIAVTTSTTRLIDNIAL